jgi:hypothetical protein
MKQATRNLLEQGGRPMKWMWSTALVVVAVSAAVSAQSGKEMNEPTMGDKMNMTYTGCIVAVNHGGSFLLTHVGDDHQTMMHHDGMMKTIAGPGVRAVSRE